LNYGEKKEGKKKPRLKKKFEETKNTLLYFEDWDIFSAMKYIQEKGGGDKGKKEKRMSLLPPKKKERKGSGKGEKKTLGIIFLSPPRPFFFSLLAPSSPFFQRRSALSFRLLSLSLSPMIDDDDND